ncbi:DUF4142 domain-containing protein [Nocardia spumae]|uniref:DUF4142 domain-containing protein n=1 Tax=Nocardia spumae TaxID=2887190 RepID=UPI001D134200|nr:DUF4142 domain-containing protein [Nocardia spumae]
MRSPHGLLLATAAAVGIGIAGTAVGTAAPPPPAPQDQQFLVAAHQGNLAELASAPRAATMGSCTQVRDLGAMLVTDHARLEAMGAAVAIPNGIALPGDPNPDQIQQLTSVGRQTGHDFDLAWLRMQEEFHTQTMQAVVGEQANGSAPQVTAVADAAAPIVEHHLALIRDALAVC